MLFRAIRNFTCKIFTINNILYHIEFFSVSSDSAFIVQVTNDDGATLCSVKNDFSLEQRIKNNDSKIRSSFHLCRICQPCRGVARYDFGYSLFHKSRLINSRELISGAHSPSPSNLMRKCRNG